MLIDKKMTKRVITVTANTNSSFDERMNNTIENLIDEGVKIHDIDIHIYNRVVDPRNVLGKADEYAATIVYVKPVYLYDDEELIRRVAKSLFYSYDLLDLIQEYIDKKCNTGDGEYLVSEDNALAIAMLIVEKESEKKMFTGNEDIDGVIKKFTNKIIEYLNSITNKEVDISELVDRLQEICFDYFEELSTLLGIPSSEFQYVFSKYYDYDKEVEKK
mgnify:CR=1 FL=1